MNNTDATAAVPAPEEPTARDVYAGLAMIGLLLVAAARDCNPLTGNTPERGDELLAKRSREIAEALVKELAR